MNDKPYNAADPKQVKEKTDKAERIKDEQENDLRELLEIPGFRRFVWRHIHETCGLLKSPASGNGSIQSQNIGMQDVGRTLWAEIERVDAAVIPKMMIEYQEAHK